MSKGRETLKKALNIIQDDIRLAEMIVYDSIRIETSEEDFFSLEALRLINPRFQIYHFHNAYRMLGIHQIVYDNEPNEYFFYWVYMFLVEREFLPYEEDDLAHKIVNIWLEYIQLYQRFENDVRYFAKSFFEYNVYDFDSDVNYQLNYIISLSGELHLKKFQLLFYEFKDEVYKKRSHNADPF